jgi:hypothetical protein
VKIHLTGSVLAKKLNKAREDLNDQIMLDCKDYVPFNQSILSNSVHTENGDEIVWNGPYARFLYMGKLMLDDRGSAWALPNTQKHVVDKDLTYSKEGHSKAGAHWFERAKEDYLDTWIETVRKAVE